MSEQVSPKHIAVACDDKVANLLLTLPVFQTLRETFPKAKITAIIPAQGLDFVKGHPSIDSIETVPANEGLLKLVTRLKSGGIDTFISLYPISRWILAAWLARIPTRIGMDYKWHNFFLTKTSKIDRAVSDRNEVEYNFELLKLMGISRFASKIEFSLNESEKNWAAEFLLKKGVTAGTPYVIVHPGAKGKALHWKLERFGQLLGYLCQIKGLKVIVTYAPDESAMVSEVTTILFSLPQERKPIVVNTGDLVLKELAALCQGAICVLSSPLGPMQLAAAVGTPTVTIFSPAPEATPIRWGAWGNENVALVPHDSHCNACQVGYSKKHNPMEALTVPEVLEAMTKFISRKL